MKPTRNSRKSSVTSTESVAPTATMRSICRSPGFFPTVIEKLRTSGLSANEAGSWRRVIVEKPFGHDLKSAQELNRIVDDVFPTGSVFRIDHYLGKETVQNLLAVRFANTMFGTNLEQQVRGPCADHDGRRHRNRQPCWVLRRHWRRARRDPEPPAAIARTHCHGRTCVVLGRTDSNGKEKVFSAIVLPKDLGRHTVRGQYTAGWQGGEPVRGFLEEDGIPKTSKTDTFAAIRLDIDSRRWAGVPFYLRTGKRLGRRVTEIAVVFKRAPHLPFSTTDTEELGSNALVIRVQPDEGITIKFGSKVPGTQMEVRDVTMDFAYGDSFTESSPGIRATHLGRPPGRTSAVPAPPGSGDVLAHPRPNLGVLGFARFPDPYEAGTWGPDTADEMLERDGRTWRRP